MMSGLTFERKTFDARDKSSLINKSSKKGIGKNKSKIG